MKETLFSMIPSEGGVLSVVHDATFRPDQAPASVPVDNGRVIFEQTVGDKNIENAEIIRMPVCLLPEGDSALLREMSPHEAGVTIEHLTAVLPTAAMLLDSTHAITSSSRGAWFHEDVLYTRTVTRQTMQATEHVLGLFKRQGEATHQLLRAMMQKNSGSISDVMILSFSDPRVMQAIETAIAEGARTLGFRSKDRNGLTKSSAALVAGSHALFGDIISFVQGEQVSAGVVGPLHLETNPPHWSQVPALSTVVRFLRSVTTQMPQPHRSLMPALFDGKPIGEFAASEDGGPQLRRDQRMKLHRWTEAHPFPLSRNPVFGHAICLMHIPDVQIQMAQMVQSQLHGDISSAFESQQALGAMLDEFLESIGFWISDDLK